MAVNLLNKDRELDQQVDKNVDEMNVFDIENESYTMICDERGNWGYSVFTDWF